MSAEIAEERSLAHWLKNKLTRCRSGKLPDEQITKLKKIPGLSDFPHVSQESRKRAAEFDGTCKNLRDWCVSHSGALSLSSSHKAISPEEMSMAVWLKNKLSFYERGKLPCEEIAKLKIVPLFRRRAKAVLGRNGEIDVGQASFSREDLDKLHNFSASAERLPHHSSDRSHDLRYASFEDWCATNGGIIPKQCGDTEEERSLATWLRNKLRDHRNGKLPDYQLAKLRKIPCLSNFPHVSARSHTLAKKFDHTYNSFKEWCSAHNGSLPKTTGGTQQERGLATWLRNKLYNYRHGKLPNEQLTKLKMLPYFLEPSPSQFQKFDLACTNFQEWSATRNWSLPKRSGDTEEERSLAIWLMTKLSTCRNGKLPDYQLAKLRKIPGLSDFPDISARSKKFDHTYNSFKEWCSAHNGSLPKQTGRTHEERDLATWYKMQLDMHLHGSLLDDHLTKLKEIPGFLEQTRSKSEKFNLAYTSFQQWCATHHGSLPKQSGDTEEERSLAMWYKQKLQNCRCGKLPDKQFAKLKKLPYFLERSVSRSQKFDVVCTSLQEWWTAHRETLPKKTGATKEERFLAQWRENKLHSYRQGKLPNEQLAKLKNKPWFCKRPGTVKELG